MTATATPLSPRLHALAEVLAASLPAERRLFTAYDPDGGYITARWFTTEDKARDYHRKLHPSCQLIGRGGLILAGSYRLAIVNGAPVWSAS